MTTTGLEGIVVAESSICWIDGQKGELLYRGYDIAELAAQSTFEETTHLLLYGELPKGGEGEAFSRRLAARRPLPEAVRSMLPAICTGSSPMETLRTVVSALSLDEKDKEDTSREANLRRAECLTAQLATIVAAYGRIREGKEPVEPDPSLSHAANFLYMLSGEKPDPELARAMDIALILHAEHGFNASTFTARVVASTLSDIHSAVTAALCSLKGPLHGGANRRVWEMLQRIEKPATAAQYVKDALARKERIMGFGHRVYKVTDPRAIVLRKLSRKCGERSGNLAWYEMSTILEETVKNEKGLYPNVDFFSASTYASMGIPGSLFTPIFAMSRIAGWSAHVLEQFADNRLIRPRAQYVGPQKRSYPAAAARG